MKKMINLWALSALVLGMFIMSTSDANATTNVSCTPAEQDCTKLGYTKTYSECAGKSYLKCPFSTVITGESYYCDDLSSCYDQGYRETKVENCTISSGCPSDMTNYFKCSGCVNGFENIDGTCDYCWDAEGENADNRGFVITVVNNVLPTKVTCGNQTRYKNCVDYAYNKEIGKDSYTGHPIYSCTPCHNLMPGTNDFTYCSNGAYAFQYMGYSYLLGTRDSAFYEYDAKCNLNKGYGPHGATELLSSLGIYDCQSGFFIVYETQCVRDCNEACTVDSYGYPVKGYECNECRYG